MQKQGKQSAQGVTYHEWLIPSVQSFAVAALLLPSFYLVLLPINEIAGLISGLAATIGIWVGMFAASARIYVTDAELRVAKARIPLSCLANARVIESEDRFIERGPRLDTRAFVRFQLGIRGLIRIENIDANDPTPYLLIATRHPSKLVKALSGEL